MIAATTVLVFRCRPTSAEVAWDRPEAMPARAGSVTRTPNAAPIATTSDVSPTQNISNCRTVPPADFITAKSRRLPCAVMAMPPYTVTSWAGARAALARTFLAPRDEELGDELQEVRA